MNFLKSRCNKGYGLHKFTNLSGTQDAVYERCVKCGAKHIIKLVNGQPNIVDYARYHAREFLIPQHRLFAHEFQVYKKNRAQRRATI